MLKVGEKIGGDTSVACRYSQPDKRPSRYNKAAEHEADLSLRRRRRVATAQQTIVDAGASHVGQPGSRFPRPSVRHPDSDNDNGK